MQLQKDLSDKLLTISDYELLPDHERINNAFLVGSLVWHMEKLLGNVKCYPDIVRVQRKAEFTKDRILIYLPILSKNRYLRLRLEPPALFSYYDHQLVNSILIAHSISIDEVLDLKYDDLTYHLFEYLENLIVSIYVSLMASSYWNREISKTTLSAVFDFLSQLSCKHYEGNAAEATVSLLPKRLRRKTPPEPVDLSELLASKKTLALFRGNRHLLECDIGAMVHNLRTLKPYSDNKILKNAPIHLAPYEYQPTFNYSRKEKALVFILNRHGDILVLLEGELILFRNENVWRIFSPETFVTAITSALSEFHSEYRRKSLIDVFSIYLGMLSFSLRNQRRGGLLVIANRNDLAKMVSRKTLKKESTESFCQKMLSEKPLPDLPVSMLCNAIALDGATLIDPGGVLIGYGAILSTGRVQSKGEGARTKAAKYASRYGLAIKVSEDGPISMYKKSRLIYQVL